MTWPTKKFLLNTISAAASIKKQSLKKKKKKKKKRSILEQKITNEENQNPPNYINNKTPISHKKIKIKPRSVLQFY